MSTFGERITHRVQQFHGDHLKRWHPPEPGPEFAHFIEMPRIDGTPQTLASLSLDRDEYEFDPVPEWGSWQPVVSEAPLHAYTVESWNRQLPAKVVAFNHVGVDQRNAERIEGAYEKAKKHIQLGAKNQPIALGISTIDHKGDVEQHIVSLNERRLSILDISAYGNIALSLTAAALEPDNDKAEKIQEHVQHTAAELGIAACTELAKIRRLGPIDRVADASTHGWVLPSAVANVGFGAVWFGLSDAPLWARAVVDVPWAINNIWLGHEVFKFREHQVQTRYKALAVTAFTEARSTED